MTRPRPPEKEREREIARANILGFFEFEFETTKNFWRFFGCAHIIVLASGKATSGPERERAKNKSNENMDKRDRRTWTKRCE